MSNIFRKFASILTIPAVLLIIYHIYLLATDYQVLSKGEGWGVVYVFGALIWLVVILFIGIVIRKNIKSKKTKLALDITLFLLLLLTAS